MGIRKTWYAVIAAAIATLGAWAGVAFACTVLAPEVYSITPESAAPGSTVVVRGQDVRSDAPVEIRWNAAKGDLLAVAMPEARALSTTVRIPDVAPGVYYLNLVASDGRVGRAAIEVAAAEGTVSAPAPQLWPSTGAEPAVEAGRGSSSAGVALLAVGVVGLFAGATVAVIRRRRVPAAASR